MDLKEGLVCLDIKKAPFEVTGFPWFSKNGKFERIPAEYLHGFPQEVIELSTDTSGGAARFRSNSRYIVLEVELQKVNTHLYHISRVGHSGFDFFIKRDGEPQHFLQSTAPEYGSPYILCRIDTLKSSPYDDSPVNIDDKKMYDFRINFPLYNGVKWLKIWVEPDSIVEPPTPWTYKDPVLFYGSSITQGACASKPSCCYINRISLALDCPVINLGFSGNAMGEEKMAKIIADQKTSAFVMDYDHNAPNKTHLEKTHWKFFSIVREAQPNLPIVLISKCDFGTSLDDNAARREVILSTYHRAIEAGDKNVYFIDGEEFFKGIQDFCTVDNVHPNDLGFQKMSELTEPLLRKILEGRE